MNATPSMRQSSSAIESAPPLSERDFKRIAEILFEDSGIHLPEGKSSLVYSRLARRLRALGLESFRDYCDLVSSAAGLDERQAMLSALTTNVTRFFREGHHFVDLAKQIRTRWADSIKAGGKLRIWSAGCSSGEEPYSIALTVLSQIPDAARCDVRILATDIDEKILARAKAGLYSAEAVEPIPAEMRNRWLDKRAGGEFSVGDEARSLIKFLPLNLNHAAWPMKGRFNAIFCRNVAIYFDQPTQDRLWSRYAGLLTSDGRLYVGHSERVSDEKFQTDGLTAYRLASAAS